MDLNYFHWINCKGLFAGLVKTHYLQFFPLLISGRDSSVFRLDSLLLLGTNLPLIP